MVSWADHENFITSGPVCTSISDKVKLLFLKQQSYVQLYAIDIYHGDSLYTMYYLSTKYTFKFCI